MDLQRVQRQLEQVEVQFSHLYETISQLTQTVRLLAEENNRLRLTNHALEEMLEQTKEPVPAPTFTTPESQKRLQAFYEEGIHICHTSFGLHRSQAECMFCQSVLDGLGEV